MALGSKSAHLSVARRAPGRPFRARRHGTGSLHSVSRKRSHVTTSAIPNDDVTAITLLSACRGNETEAPPFWKIVHKLED